MKYPLNVIIWLVPFILVLGYFSFSSGSTLYFLITTLFLFGVIILIYPFYSMGQENIAEIKENVNVKGEVQELEKWWDEAINEKAVSQRLVEEKVYSIAIEEISDRLEIRKEDVPKFIESGELKIEKNASEALRKILRRRYNLDVPVSRKEFESDINIVIDFLGGKNGY